MRRITVLLAGALLAWAFGAAAAQNAEPSHPAATPNAQAGAKPGQPASDDPSKREARRERREHRRMISHRHRRKH